ncbi:nitrilase-related carbon-nitrogen hydrolase [Nitratifractor salsuginis]|uniref:Nitrilase/cyanide hydratase and apolipoprotein N-acyltransferase n=1 Tax=Nitratifractor salsuginis (strain DSM 16511 / JCM 12458 / E9I37-1) TaxID=749222 RepID=E6WXX3_NITSE|nr:nitrilase-related carbon-nitrogen hydrolase [Nitratifractor salsuginis]ADV45294.1 Nitrilase/cyanide hydratase and apolipoprotein N-acyltransferase [Nitratifractor salsuginis DSM 16511]
MKKTLDVTLLQLDNLRPYRRNLEKILAALEEETSDLILAPEVCLTDYDYEHLEEAVAFGEEAEALLLEAVGEKILAFTRLVKRDAGYVNEAIVLHSHRVVHRQAKHRLFPLGEEERYLIPGALEEIRPFEIGGVRYGLLICFELRFKELWRRLEGCDVILVPAQWGLPRKRHLEILARALGVMNQCYVLVANSAREDMARSSLVASPDGGLILEDMAERIRGDLDLRNVRLLRRYLKVY